MRALLLLGALALVAAPRRAPSAGPVPVRVELPGDWIAFLQHEPEASTTTLNLQLPRAVLDETEGLEGSLALAAHALACQLQRPGSALHARGGMVAVRVGWDALDLTLVAPGDALAATARGLGELVQARALEPGCLQQARSELLAVRGADDDGEVLARWQRALFPSGRRGAPRLGPGTRLGALTPPALLAQWRQQLARSRPVLSAIGPASIDAMATALTPQLASLAHGGERAPRTEVRPALAGVPVEIVDGPATEPARLVIGLRLGTDPQVPPAVRALLLDAWLEAGAPRTLASRGCQGLVDGAAALPGQDEVLALRCPGLPVALVRPLLDQAAADLDRLRRTPLPARALRSLQVRRRGELLLALESPAARARALCALAQLGADPASLARLPDNVAAVDARALQAAAVALLAPGALRVAVGGPAAALAPQLADLQP